MERRNDFTRSCIDMGMVRKARCGQKMAFARSLHIWRLKFIFVCHIWLWYKCLSPMHSLKWKPNRLLDNKKQSCCSFCRWLCETNVLVEISQISNQSGLLPSNPWAWLMFLVLVSSLLKCKSFFMDCSRA